MKSIFLKLTTGVYEKRMVREWLVLFLNEIIASLRKQSIKHFFMANTELLVKTSMENELCENFKNKGIEGILESGHTKIYLY